jgi:hypothetical protein
MSKPQLANPRIFCRTYTLSRLACRVLGITLLLSAVFICTAGAQDEHPSPSPTPADADQQRIDEIDKQIKLAGKKKELIEAEKQLFSSSLPTPHSTPLAGNATLSDDATLESELLAYQSMTAIAREIGSKVKPKAKFVVIYNPNDGRAIQLYATVKSQLTQLEQGYKDYLKPPKPSTGPGTNGESALVTAAMMPQAATSVLGSIADVLAMFHTDVDIKGKSFTFDEVALVSQLVPELSGEGRRVIYPVLYAPDMLSEVTTDIPEILTLFSNVFKQKAQADDIIAAYDAKDEAGKKQDPYRARIPTLKALGAAFDKYAADLSKLDDQSGTSPMASLIRAERLNKVLVQPDAAMLYVKILRAGGNNRVTKNLFKGTKISHSGGTVVSYMLFDNTGTAVLANTLYNYDGYKRFKSKYGTLSNNLSNFPAPPASSGIGNQ